MALVKIDQFGKAKWEGRMYDVRSINFENGHITICSENSGLTGGLHKNLNEDEIQLYAEVKK